jgi:DNA-binding transcriptional ArsR family regulator
MTQENAPMDEFVDVAKALSDPSRVRVFCALRERELCVCQIVELLGLAASTVSKHMAILRRARLVESRKDGRWVYYRRADGRLTPAAAGATAWCDDVLARDAALRDDAARVKKILCTPLEELCRA